MTEMGQLPEKNIPVLSLRNTVLFPGQALPLWVSSAQSVAAIEAALAGDSWIFVVRSINPNSPDSAQNLHRIGVLAKIEKLRKNRDESYQLLVSSYHRFEVQDFIDTGSFWVANGAQRLDREDLSESTKVALEKSLRENILEILQLLPSDTSRLENILNTIRETDLLAYSAIQYLDISDDKKLEILSMDSQKSRFLKILDVLVKFKEELQVKKEIGEKISSEMSRRQRDAILREQLKAIQSQLGEGDDADKKEELREKIEKAGMSAEAKAAALEQLKRLEAMGNMSPESHVIRNYLELLVALPWKEPEQEFIDLEHAKNILDEDHYGLDKIKDRILEHLAVMKLRDDNRGTIILLVGPPGVGKTSLGKSIAKALDREFVRVSLGGVRDDAEIRGHRRTYVGAMPGRIIEGIKRAKSRNPVFLLDEVDKLARSFGGDPAAALLEVLDPEQNDKFFDHYLDLPFDLSKVVFIATANQLDTIPGPLLDRMERIQISGYSNEEKFHIGKEHLIPRVLEEVGLKRAEVEWSEDLLKKVIQSYTRESGVRELQRKMSAVARAMARQKIELSGASLQLTEELIEKALGPALYREDRIQKINPPGVVTGLAWTPVGGEILSIESSWMPGAGKLQLTGQLGDVMKESSQIALTLARGKFRSSFSHFKFSENDIHVHVPSGAIPKDGPSAGVTMLTSLVSLLSQRPVDSKVAMTGEITLSGRILPVGGIKEKLIAAHRAGIKKVLLPSENKRDLREVPKSILDDLEIIPVEMVQELISHALKIELQEDSPVRVASA